MSNKTAWQQADAVLDRLLDLPASQRSAALNAMALADDVRMLVERLLSAHDHESAILDRPLQGHAEHAAENSMRDRRFGAWVIEREIGRGGMAVVYRAHHHQQAERVAALKLVTLGALAAAGIERFWREQSILARLSHPHIVPLFDSGIAEDGTPWLVMALVEGERIDRWCEVRGLDTRARVHMFLDVCDAVNYAHQNLVVHRDIKPSNVLVDGSGQVRLLDFGIARLTDGSESTASAYRALTPGYAAPEQFSGAPAATTMDIYGLAALLHAIVAGTPPQHAGADAVAGYSGELEIPASLRGDLGAIVRRALAIEPKARYDSVAVLRQDIEAWLDHRPVAAQRSGFAYRARKFVSRHRLGLGAAALLSLSLIAGAAATYWQYQRTLEAASLATSQAQRATAVKDFLVGLFNAPDPEQPGGAVDTQTVFRRGVEQLRKSDSIDPAARMDMLKTMADVQYTMSWYDDAAVSYETAIALGRAHPDTLRLALADAIAWRGILRRDTNKLSESEADFAEAMDLMQGVNTAQSRVYQVRLLTQWAMLDSALQKPARALERLDRADALAAMATDLPFQSAVNLLSVRGSTYFELGRYEDALSPLRKAMELQRSAGNVGNASMALALSWLAAASAALNRVDEALAYDREGVDVARASYPAGHAEIGNALYSFGDSLRQAGRFDEALKQFDEAIAIQSKSHRRRGSLVLTQLARTRALLALGRYKDVIEDVDQVRAPLEAELGASSMAAVQLTEQELTALAELHGADIDPAIAHARQQLDGLSPELAAQPVAQSLRWCIADVLLDRNRSAESGAWRADLEQHAANAPPQPSIQLRIAVLPLRIAVHNSSPEVAELATTLVATLDASAAATVESRAYGWLAVADAAVARRDAALLTRSSEALQALAHVHPLPQPLAHRIEAMKRIP